MNRLQQEIKEKRIVLPLSEEQYIRYFATLYLPFENNRSTESKVADRWTKAYLKTFTPRTILSIGAGTGEFDAFFINNLAMSPQYYCGVEPTPGHEKILRKTLSNLQSPPDNITIITRPFDQNFQPIESECKYFDVILFVHCLYAMPDPAQVIQYATQFLSDDGRIIIYSGCFEGICEIYEKFVNEFNLVWATPSWQDHVASAPLQNHSVTIESISYGLRKLGVRHFMERMNSFLDMTPFFEDDRPIIIEILSFIMQTDITQFPEYDIQKMINYVKTYSKFNPKTKRYEFYKPSGFIVVPNNKAHSY